MLIADRTPSLNLLRPALADRACTSSRQPPSRSTRRGAVRARTAARTPSAPRRAASRPALEDESRCSHTLGAALAPARARTAPPVPRDADAGLRGRVRARARRRHARGHVASDAPRRRAQRVLLLALMSGPPRIVPIGAWDRPRRPAPRAPSDVLGGSSPARPSMRLKSSPRVGYRL